MKFDRVLACAALLGALLPATGVRAADPAAQMAVKAGCTACHALDKKLIGPAYKDVAAKYKGKADAVATITQRIRKGSKDVWGPVPMPPTEPAKLGDADLKAVVNWLLKTPG
jgi:cytochrome c